MSTSKSDHCLRIIILILVTLITIIIVFFSIASQLRKASSSEKLILIGGGYNANGAQNVLYTFDINSGRLSQLSLTLNRSRYSPISGNFNGKVIFSGGWSTHSEALASTEIFSTTADVKRLRLTLVNYIFSAKYDACGGIHKGHLYSCFGHDGHSILDYCDVLNLHTMKYRHLKPQISGRITTCILHEGHLYTVGGWLGGNKFTNQVFKIDLRNGIVNELQSYPILQHYLSSAVYFHGKMIVCGGKIAHYSNPYIDSCYAYNFDENSWILKEAMPTVKAGHRMITVSNYNRGKDAIFVFGGYDRCGFLSIIQRYLDGNWTNFATLPVNLAQMGLVLF